MKEKKKLGKTEEFWAFVDRKREERGFNWYSLEKAAGLANGAIRNRYQALSSPSARLCIALAKALSVPVEEIFNRAGILPKDALSTIGNNPSFREVLAIMRQLNEQQQRDLLDFARWKLDQVKRGD